MHINGQTILKQDYDGVDASASVDMQSSNVLDLQKLQLDASSTLNKQVPIYTADASTNVLLTTPLFSVNDTAVSIDSTSASIMEDTVTAKVSDGRKVVVDSDNVASKNNVAAKSKSYYIELQPHHLGSFMISTLWIFLL